MARSMPSPWLFNALTDIFREDSELAHANLQNKKWPPKMVQVVSCNSKLSSLVVSDKEHMITVFLTQKCMEDILEQHSFTSLKYCQVKIANYHFSTVLQSAGHFDLALLHSQKVVFPLAIQCAKLTYMGASDIELIGEPVDVNKDQRIQRILGSLKYHDMVKKLISRQYNFADDVVGRLPIHDGGQLVLERYSEENLPQLRHAEIPAELLSILEERRSAVTIGRGEDAVAPSTTGVPTRQSSSSSASSSASVTQSAAAGVVPSAGQQQQGDGAADSFADSQQLLYGDSQEEEVVFVGEKDSQPLRDSQMIVVEEEEAQAANKNSGSSSSGGSSSRSVATPGRPSSTSGGVGTAEERRLAALYERLMTPSSTAAVAASSQSQGSSQSSGPSSVTTLGSADHPSAAARTVRLQQAVVDLTQADDQEMHHFLLGRYQQSNRAWPSPAVGSSSSSSTPAATGVAGPSLAPLPMLPPSSSGSLPLYVKSPIRQQPSLAPTSSDVLVPSLVGRRTLQKVGRHVFRGVVLRQEGSKYVIQYEDQDGDTDEMSEEDLLRILVPVDVVDATQSQAAISNNQASETVPDLSEIATQPQYYEQPTGGAGITAVPPAVPAAAASGVLSMEDDDDEPFMNMLRALDNNYRNENQQLQNAAPEPAAVTAAVATPSVVPSTGTPAAASSSGVISQSRKMLDDLQGFILRVNKRKTATSSSSSNSGVSGGVVSGSSTSVTADSESAAPSKRPKNSAGVAVSGRQSLNGFMQFLLKHGL